MITVKNMKELTEFVKAGFKTDLEGICERCGVSIHLKPWTLKRKLGKDDLLCCKGCSVSVSKGKYTKEDKEKISEKRKSTNLEKYGIENTYQLDKVKKLSSNRDWTERNLNSQQTCLNKYGVPNSAQVPAVKEKTKQTVIERYGSIEQSYADRVEKSKITYLEHYGVDHNFKSAEWRRERDEIIIQKYGRMIYSRTYVYKDMCFDSSWELAYYIWLSDAKIPFTYQPITNFYYLGSDDLTHKYHPDFLVNGEYQEIKGDQFFDKDGKPYCAITKSWWNEKYEFIKENHVKLLRHKDILPMLQYVTKTYGKDYLKSFKVKIKSK